MKKQQEVVVVRKNSCGWWSVIKALLILAGLVYVTVKLYDKFVAKKAAKSVLVPDDNEADAALESTDDTDEGLCASASDVIANPENME